MTIDHSIDFEFHYSTKKPLAWRKWHICYKNLFSVTIYIKAKGSTFLSHYKGEFYVLRNHCNEVFSTCEKKCSMSMPDISGELSTCVSHLE